MNPDRRTADPIDVSQRAYELWLERGAAPGRALDDWLQAESELRSGPRQNSPPRSLPDELEAVRASGTNLLLVGPDYVTRAIVSALGPHLRQPLVAPSTAKLRLPVTRRPGTLVLEEISTLTPVDQARLLKWLDDPVVTTQVISTTSEALVPLLEGGGFLLELYYRLNTVCLDVNPV